MKFFRARFLIPVRPFLLRFFPVFISAIFMGILGGTAVVALLEHYYPRTAPWAFSAADAEDRKSTRLNSSHYQQSRMPSSA